MDDEPALSFTGIAAMSPASAAATGDMEVLDDLYQRWRRDPASVDASWRSFFEGFELGTGRPAAPSGGGAQGGAEGGSQGSVVRLIYAYRDLGHFLAHLD